MTMTLKALVGAALLLPILAGAQVPTPAPLLNEQLPGQASPERSQLEAEDPIKAGPAPEVSKPLSDVQIDVSAYQLDGLDNESTKALTPLLAPFTGPARSFEDLSNAAQTVTAFVQRELGYYLAYAYLPAQEVKDGVVRIHVLPGILEAVEVNWSDDLRVKRSVIENHLARLKPGTVIKVSDVERVVFLLNDLRGLKMTFAIKPGTQPGQAILVANPSSDKALSGQVALDNHGSRFAGEYRATASLSWDSPLGLGDGLSLSHLRSTTGGLDFTLLGYTLPLGSDGLKAGVNVSRVNYKLDDNLFPLGLSGQADAVGVFALYPLKRSRNFNLFALAAYDQKQFTDKQSLAGLTTVKDIDAVRLGLSGDTRDRFFSGGLNVFSLNMEQSEVSYQVIRPFGLDDAEKSRRINYSLGRLQSAIPGRLILWGSLRGQVAQDNLDSSDQCSLGGANSVRAFAQGEGSGDSCMLMTLEARTLFAPRWFGTEAREMSLNLFYDHGRVQLRKDASQQFLGFVNRRELSGYGLSLVWERSREFLFNISIAWQGRGETISDPKDRDPRLYTTFVYTF